MIECMADEQAQLERVGRSIAHLAAMSRSSAREGERSAAMWVAAELRDLGLEPVVAGYRYQQSYALAHGVHEAAGLLAACVSGPQGAAIAAAALASLELEASGRAQWLRALLPKGEGSNVIARIPAEGAAAARLVLVAHIDAANTGWIWNPALVALGAARARRNRAMAPVMAPVAGSLAAVAAGALAGRTRGGRLLRGAGAAGLAAALSVCFSVGRGATVPGASDNASGVAALLELARQLRRSPLPGVEVTLLACGSEEAGMGGMRAFLDEHAGSLGCDCLVLGIDTIGAGTPIVCSAEGPIVTHRYEESCIALVEEGAAQAGQPSPERWRIGAWTDPILARFAGLPAASLLSVGPGYYPGYHHPTDTADRVDLECVRRCITIALGTAERYAERVAAGSWPVASASRSSSSS
jgi:hypothetical protein